MVFLVDDDDGSDGAAAETGEGLQGESAVFGRFTGADVELPFELIQNLRSAPDMTGRPQANQARVFAAGGEAESAEECGDADGVDERYPQPARDQTEGFRRKIIVGGLDIKKDGDEVLF